MLLAAMTLLSMSLNAQLLPQYQGGANYGMPQGTPGKTQVMAPGDMLRMPTLNAGEYLFGPYVTDDFNSTGYGFPNSYNAQQVVRILTVLTRDEFNTHLGDSIIGFRLALPGSTDQTVRVHNFYSLPYSANGWGDKTVYNHVWPLNGLTHIAEGGEGGGGTEPGGETTTQYVKVTSSSDLTDGEYLIVCETQNVVFNGSLNNTALAATNNQLAVTISDNTIASSSDVDAATFTYNSSEGSLKSNSGYYIYRATGTSGGSVTTSTTVPTTVNEITFSSGNASIKCTTTNNNYYLRYNSSSNCFRYYTSASQTAIQLYKKVTVTRHSLKSNTRAIGTITVGNGDTYNSYLPVYGYEQDYGYTNQMIYTADQLGLTAGSEITSLTFYPRSGFGINFYGSTVTLSVGNTSTSSYSSNSTITPSDLTAVASKRITATDNTVTEWAFTFNEPFTYNGENLLVQVSCPGYYYDGTSGQYATSYFMGDSQSSYVCYADGSRSTFLPKATFGYNGSTTGGGASAYMDLAAGQWHDFYLDEPIEFQVSGDSIGKLEIGYDYTQYPAGTSGQLLYPIGYNSNSQTHDHYAYMYGSASTTTYNYSDITITSSNWYVEFSDITVYDADGNVLTHWDANSTDTYTQSFSSGSSTCYNLPDGWTKSVNHFVQEGDGSADDPYTAYLNGGSSSTSAYITIPGSLLSGISSSSIRLVCTVKQDGGTGTLTLNGGSATSLTTTLSPYELTINGTASTTTTYTSAPQWYHLNTVSSQYGDLAVQLIFRSGLEKTNQPTISTREDNNYTYVIATAPADDPNAMVTLTVNGTTASGVGSVEIPIGRAENDYTVHATATAQAEGKRVSDPTEDDILIPASNLTPTPTPDINSQVLDVSVEVTGSGEGEVHMYIDGQEVTSPYYLERTDEEYSVIVVVTAMINDYEHAMSSTTQTVVVPPISFDPEEGGWTLLPGQYENDEVITWDNNLMFVDRFTASTAQNNHASKYFYKMTEDATKLEGNPRTTNEHIIPVMKTGTRIVPYYPLDSVTADVDHNHMTPYVMNANAEMTVEQSTEIYYYTLDRSINSKADEDYLELTNLQNDGAKYLEMGDLFKPKYKEFQFGEIVPRLDSINGLQTGNFNENFMTYVPIVWTLGNLSTNKRQNWDNDHKHNSYGAPIWMTGAPQVNTVYLEAQMQRGPQGSTQWEDPNDGSACSLYFLGVEAIGEVPSPSTTNIECEPYMFRVWVESPSGQLRGYNYVPEDKNRPVKPGAHYEGDGSSFTGPICVYEGLTTDGHLYNHLQAPDEGNNMNWSDRIEFGAVDNISDLIVYIRFYYKSNGNAAETPAPNGYYLRGNRGSGDGYGAGDGGGNPGISTSIKGVFTDSYHGEVVSTTYVNAQGMQSDKPFKGVNIVVTRYTDGTTSTTKVVR